MTVKKRKDTQVARVFMHKIADIRGGVSVASSVLGGDYLYEGTPLSAPVDGICYVIKYAVVAADVADTDTTITVKIGHHFQVGDVVLTATGSVAATITAITTNNSNSSYDDITISAALGAISAGDYIAEAAAETTGSDSALAYTPVALVGTGKPVISGVNIDTDAWVIGVTKGNDLPSYIASELTGIVNYD